MFSLIYISKLEHVSNLLSYNLVSLIPTSLLMYLAFSQIKRYRNKDVKNILKTIVALSGILLYYKVIDLLSITSIVKLELIILPWIILMIVFRTFIWTKYRHLNKVEFIVLGVCSLLLFFNILNSDVLLNAVILGFLSLAYIFGGMHFKIKAYFTVGVISLISNVLFQTKGFWQNVPWWL